MNLTDKKLPLVAVVNTALCNEQTIEFLLQFADEYVKDRVKRLVSLQDKANSVVGCVLRKWIIKRVFGVDFDAQEIEFESFGKPYLKGQNQIHFNISHSGEMVVCAVHDKPVGVDVQKITEYRPKVAQYIFDKEEQAQLDAIKDKDRMFTSLWSQKESKIKLLGCGVSGHKGKSFDGIKTTCTEQNGYIISLSVYE